MTEPKTLAIRMTAAYYVELLMRENASIDDREILRRLALHGVYRLIGDGDLDHRTLLTIPYIDGDAITI